MSVFDRDDEREYKDISDFTTSELVAELEKRDGVIIPHPEHAGQIVYEAIWTSARQGKPCPKILVVRE